MNEVLSKFNISIKDMFNNIKSNIWLFISLVCFVVLNVQTKDIIICQIISIILIFLTLTKINNVFGKTKETSKVLKVLAVISTIGIAYYVRERFFNNILQFNIVLRYLDSHLIQRGVAVDKIGYILMVASTYSIYTLVLLVFKYLANMYKDIINDVSKKEKIFYLVITLALFIAVIAVYNNTNAFYGNIFQGDVVFSCDSPGIVNENAYMNIYNGENDIRQPLFAFLSMPFFGIIWTINLALPFHNVIQPILMDIVQVALLVFANFAIAKLLKLDSKGRMLFLFLTMCTYMNIMYTFIMEQYVVAYFWLITCIYAICNNKQDKYAISAAGGALVTNLFLSLWIPKENPVKNTKKYIFELIKIGVFFLFLVLIFARADILMPKMLEFKTSIFVNFMNKEELTFVNKFQQYSEFVKNCFISPNVRIYPSFYCEYALLLQPITTFNFVGIAILILSIIGFIVSRKEKLSQIAFAWILYSILILGIFGWGAAENGMILYSLYFGWAFLVLLYQLVKVISSKIKFKNTLYIITFLLIVLIVLFNIRGVYELLEYAISNHPVVWIY